jgi:RIO kinase 2
MSSAEKAAGLLLELEPEEYRVLQAIELGMASFSFVPIDELLKYAKMPQREVEFRLGALNKKDLIYRQSDPYPGYILNYTGYDLLALNALSKADILNSLGRPIGVGKEADILDAITDNGERVAVKFHRLGRTSFRETRKKRGYIERRGHASWHYQSRLAAEREFSVQSRVHDWGVSTPQPIRQNRHVIVMGYIDGYNLNDVARLDDPNGFLEDILENVRETYKAGVVHADLSDYNIVVQKDGTVLLIDWPQAVETDHPNAESLLERDVRNVLRFFQRKFRLDRSLEGTLEYVKN